MGPGAGVRVASKAARVAGLLPNLGCSEWRNHAVAEMTFCPREDVQSPRSPARTPG